MKNPDRSLSAVITAFLFLASPFVLQHANAQAFTNLDFESAVLVGDTNPFTGQIQLPIEFGPAFPGWIGMIGTNIATEILLDSIALSTSDLGLLSNLGIYGNIQGKWTAMIEAGVSGAEREPASASLMQSGLVPATAQSLQFKALGPLQVSLNGQVLAAVPLLKTSSYTLYGADITAFSGSTAELRFTVFPPPNPFNPIATRLDDIVFSPQPLPVLSVQSSGGNLVLSFPTVSGQSYLVEQSSDLGNWSTYTSIIASSTATQLVVSTPNTQAFFRYRGE